MLACVTRATTHRFEACMVAVLVVQEFIVVVSEKYFKEETFAPTPQIPSLVNRPPESHDERATITERSFARAARDTPRPRRIHDSDAFYPGPGDSNALA